MESSSFTGSKDGNPWKKRKLILAESKIKKGEFEDWILPAVVNDFKKKRKEDLESNPKRAEMLRDTFLSFVEWETTERRSRKLRSYPKSVSGLPKSTSAPITPQGFADKQHELPSIEKPKIDPLKIDPDKESPSCGMCTPYPSNRSPSSLRSGLHEIEVADGIIYPCRNPSMIFSPSRYEWKRLRHSPCYPMRKDGPLGAEDTSAEELKIEWYKLGTNFSFGSGLALLLCLERTG